MFSTRQDPELIRKAKPAKLQSHLKKSSIKFDHSELESLHDKYDSFESPSVRDDQHSRSISSSVEKSLTAFHRRNKLSIDSRNSGGRPSISTFRSPFGQINLVDYNNLQRVEPSSSTNLIESLRAKHEKKPSFVKRPLKLEPLSKVVEGENKRRNSLEKSKERVVSSSYFNTNPMMQTTTNAMAHGKMFGEDEKKARLSKLSMSRSGTGSFINLAKA